MKYAVYLQPHTPESLLRENKLTRAEGSWVLRTTVEPCSLSRGFFMANLVPFFQRRQILAVRQLSKFQKRAVNRKPTARDRRNWKTLRQAPSLLYLSVRLSRSQGDDTDRSRSLQAEIRQTLIEEANAGHIRKILTH